MSEKQQIILIYTFFGLLILLAAKKMKGT